MKVVSVIVSFLLIASEARIVEFWQPRGDRTTYSEESLVDSYGAPFIGSQEEIYEDGDVTERERNQRASYYQPNYGYSKNANKWKQLDQGETKSKVKSKYFTDKSSAKYTAYGKPQQKPWRGLSFGSGQKYRQQPKSVPAPVYGNRKKDHRSAQMFYNDGYQGPPPPQPHPMQHYTATAPLVPFYHELQPKPSCGNRIVIGCTPKVTEVPCGFSAHLPVYQQPSYYPQGDVVGSPGPAPFPEEPQYVPEHPHGYNPLEPPPPPPSAPNSGYSFQPVHEVPPPSSQLPTAPAGYSFNQPPPHQLTTKQPFDHNKHVSSFFEQKTTAKPFSSYAPPYQPTYKAPSEPSGFPVRNAPSFSHPVKEPTNENAHPAPHISAFPSTQGPTTSSTSSTTVAPRRLPTVPADRDQNYRVVIDDEMAAAAPGGAGNKEASGDEEPSSTVPPPSTSTGTTTATLHGHDEGHATTQPPA